MIFWHRTDRNAYFGHRDKLLQLAG